MVTTEARPSNEPPRIFSMNANEVMKQLSKKHARLPVAALNAAVELRSEVAPLMLAELKGLLATFDANLDAPTEKDFRAKMKQAVKKPSALFYGFFLAPEWKQKDAFRPFTDLLSWPEAMLPNLLSEEVVSEDGASRILAQFYDGDPASLFRLLLDPTASDSVRFWQWRTLIRVVIKGEIDHGTLRSLLARAVGELPQEGTGWYGPVGSRSSSISDRRTLCRWSSASMPHSMFQRTVDDFKREWAYARAHPECPFEGDAIEFYRGLTDEVDSAIENR
jgi:hypothetical protein